MKQTGKVTIAEYDFNLLNGYANFYLVYFYHCWLEFHLFNGSERPSWVYLSTFLHLRNKDGMLSKEEVLSSQNLFVASQATDYGKKIKNARDEL